MLDESIRTAILQLHERGHGVRAIARALQVSRAAVRDVLRRGTAEVPRLVRPERAGEHEADIRALYLSCRGNLVRVHEELTARGAVVSYQALTAFCRRHAIGAPPPTPVMPTTIPTRKKTSPTRKAAAPLRIFLQEYSD